MRHKEAYEYKTRAKRAAKELMYGQEVIQKIDEATTESEITHILREARRKDIGDDMRDSRYEGIHMAIRATRDTLF